jgi:CRP/FNR family cyclic AMP-dependent transcriptional regulator
MEQTRLQWFHAGHSGEHMHRAPAERRKTDVMDKTSHLHALPLFDGLDDETLHYLAKDTWQRQFNAGDIICYQGDPGSTCHIITRGRVRVFVVDEDGRELSVRIMGPGEIIGEMALLDSLPRSASIEALEKTHTLELNRDALLWCLRESPQLSLNLLQSLSSRLRSSTAEAGELASLTVVERLMRRLQQLAELSGQPVPGGVRVMLPMTQQDLAALVGTSRESVNRALVRLRRQGKVRLEQGWVVLLDEVSSSPERAAGSA